MKPIDLLIVLCASLPLVAQPPQPEVAPGPLVIVGGGGLPEGLLRRMLMLAGSPDAAIAILPQASELPDAGDSSLKAWKQAGASNVSIVDLGDREVALASLRRARAIWMPGGDQSRLMSALSAADLVEALRACHRDGAVVGGTSAGAAVLTELMIARDGAERAGVGSARVELSRGLGLLPEFVVDQHFQQRGRFPRLLSCILAHRDHCGLGIDERTAVIVGAERLEIFGDGGVLLVDARSAASLDPKPSVDGSWSNVTLHHLRAGARVDRGSWKPMR